MILKLGGLGLNRVNPPHELLQQGDFVQCSKLQNYVARNNKITKIGGTKAYNPTALEEPILWCKRSYHKLGDNSFVKRTLAYSGTSIYAGDDVAGTLEIAQGGFNNGSIPLDMTMQVAGNSILFIFTGDHTPVKYDGNSGFTFNETALDTDIEGGVVHLQRGFYWKKDDSVVQYSKTLLPESIDDEIIFGNDKNSVVRHLVRGANESFYVFKSDSIWQLFGRTPSQFQARIVTDKYGLASKRGIYPVGSGFVFLDEFTKELYFFGGSESSIQPLTESDIKLRDIMDLTPDALAHTDMTVHDGLFRFAFQHEEDNQWGDFNSSELVYPVNEPDSRGLPKWSIIRGSRVGSYSVWNQQGDKEELVTGRADTGKLMYHNRGNNFDGEAIVTVVRTKEITASEEFVVRFKGFYIKASPGSADNEATFKYFVNGRISDRGEHPLDMEGETRTVGVIRLQKSVLFNDRIVPFMDSSRGNSISFEIEDSNLSNDMEIYSFAFDAKKLYVLRNQLI